MPWFPLNLAFKDQKAGMAPDYAYYHHALAFASISNNFPVTWNLIHVFKNFHFSDLASVLMIFNINVKDQTWDWNLWWIRWILLNVFLHSFSTFFFSWLTLYISNKYKFSSFVHVIGAVSIRSITSRYDNSV